MEIVVTRTWYTLKSTISKITVDGKFFGFGLEDVVRWPNETKVYGLTAIPAGTYKVVMSMSNRFKVVMPEVLNVPGYAGIRIHSGNSDVDTDGCLILGLDHKTDWVSDSRTACANFYGMLNRSKSPITIKYVDTQEPLTPKPAAKAVKTPKAGK